MLSLGRRNELVTEDSGRQRMSIHSIARKNDSAPLKLIQIKPSLHKAITGELEVA